MERPCSEITSKNESHDKDARARAEHDNTQVQEILKFLSRNRNVSDCRQKATIHMMQNPNSPQYPAVTISNCCC